MNQEGLWSCSFFFFSNIFPWCCVSRLKCNLKFRICGVVLLAFYKNASFQSQFKAMLSENGKILLYNFVFGYVHQICCCTQKRGDESA